MKSQTKLQEELSYLHKQSAYLTQDRRDAYSAINPLGSKVSRELWYRLRDTIDGYYNEHDAKISEQIRYLESTLEVYK